MQPLIQQVGAAAAAALTVAPRMAAVHLLSSAQRVVHQMTDKQILRSRFEARSPVGQ